MTEFEEKLYSAVYSAPSDMGHMSDVELDEALKETVAEFAPELIRLALEQFVSKIKELAMMANGNRQDAINNEIDHLNSYYHGKLIAYEEMLNYILKGTTELNRKCIDGLNK